MIIIVKKEPLELSEILAVQVECNACQDTKSFRLNQADNILVHACQQCGPPPVRDDDWMKEVAKIATAIENVRASVGSKFKLSFIVWGKL
jgi:hypothetical protein